MPVMKLRRPLLAACAVLGTAAGALWGVYLIVGLPAHWDRADLGAAITMSQATVTVGAVRLCRDRDKQLLMRALAELSQRAANAETVPLQRLEKRLRAV